ncbi:hypothetical protein, partial [Lunatimonas salinarum]|uniref:hypothetical protein n=1 Tax=Lunatimonas salinarum TaxID=1774590 RepID=UPI001AE018A6
LLTLRGVTPARKGLAPSGILWYLRYQMPMPGTHIGFAKWRVQCYYDSLVQGSSSVFQLNICAENPPLRKAENRYLLC